MCIAAVIVAIVGCCFFVYKAMDEESECRPARKVIAQGGILWIDYQYFCRYGDGYGRQALSTGRFPVTLKYSKHDDVFLPSAGSIGWLGSSSKNGLVLGHVLGPDGVIPCEDTVAKLKRRLVEWEKQGYITYLEVSDVSIF